MVLPEKHIGFSESLLGLGSFILEMLFKPKNIDSLWQDLKTTQNLDNMFTSHNFENLVLSVDILFAIGLIAINDNGNLIKTPPENDLKIAMP